MAPPVSLSLFSGRSIMEEGVKWRSLTSADMAAAKCGALSIDVAESPEKRIERLIRENPVVIFSRESCCMCHVMRRLFSNVGVHPTVIELDEPEEAAAAVKSTSAEVDVGLPTVFIGGSPVGGLEGLMALHLSGRLVPRLHEVGALW